MSLTGLAVTRPVASTVLSLLIVVVGTAALLNLPVREYPDIDDPTVTATIVYPGASAEVVERDVVEPIEEAVSGIDGVRQVRSQAQDGRARIEGSRRSIRASPRACMSRYPTTRQPSSRRPSARSY